MTREACTQQKSIIEVLAAGRFDNLSVREIQEAEAHLNECTECASRLSDVQVVPDLSFRSVVRTPGPGDWEKVWTGIQERSSANPTRRYIKSRRSWGGLSIAAAILLAFTLWQMIPVGASSDWGIALAGADEIQIESLEVFDDATTFVLSTGDESDASVIWVVEEEET